MAELLIYNRTDPDAARRTFLNGYRLGDVVVVMPNGHQWGSDELNTDKFYILRVPDLTVEGAEELTKEQEGAILDADGDPVFFRRREFWLDESVELTGPERNRLHSNTLTIPMARMLALKKQKPR